MTEYFCSRCGKTLMNDENNVYRCEACHDDLVIEGKRLQKNEMLTGLAYCKQCSALLDIDPWQGTSTIISLNHSGNSYEHAIIPCANCVNEQIENNIIYFLEESF